MSLLNQPFAVPSRVKGAVQFLVRERGQRVLRESAEALLSPPSLKGEEGEPDNRAMVRRTIDECVRLRLFLEEGDYLSLNPELPAAVRDAGSVAQALPGTVLDLILGGSGNEDLMAPLAWFLAQDALNAPGTWDEFASALQTQGVADIFRFNGTRYDNFWYWSRYLGLTSAVGTPPTTGSKTEERLMPDPTDCLRRVLQRVLGGRGDRRPLADALRHVSTLCPLFEGGAVRDTMDRYAPGREARHLSSSTSLALLRLQEEGSVDMRMLSDADAVVLVDGPDRRSVSEILWAGGTGAAA